MTDGGHQPRRGRFAPLPGWNGQGGGGRRVGVEIEFGNLAEAAAAHVAQALLGGDLQDDVTEFVLRDSALGAVEIYLDTAWRDTLGKPALDAGRLVIPVEIVTPPRPQGDLPLVQTLMERLSAAGATGTQGGILMGFGLHLNVEIADPEGADIPAVGTVFAFLEQWMRDRWRMNLSRRLLPFTDRYPASFLDALAEGAAPHSPEMFCTLYLDHTPSRNRGLDLLPALRHLFPDAVSAALGPAVQIAARPAYHFRLPDCRIGEPGWSLADEWHRWVLVERAARTDGFCAELCTAWRRRSWSETRTFGGWIGVVDELLREAGLVHPGEL